MDFDRLPNEIRLKIFLQLPFEERVRSARVSKRFKQMSKMVISRTKAFDLTADIFHNANAKTMSRLIKQCAGNLREVVHGYTNHRHTPYRIKMFSKFFCPRLAKLDVGYGRIEHSVLRNLLANSPNLRSLKWKCPRDAFPSNVVCEKLEKVDLQWCTTEFFESLVQNCPNLKDVVLALDLWGGSHKEWEQTLNKIFANKSDLETLDLEDSSNELQIDQLQNLWGLIELRSLSLQCREISDETMVKISKDFRHLECLRLESSSHSQQKVSSRGVGALSSLKHLRELELSQHPHGEFDIDRGAWRLAECGRLRVVRFTDQLSPTTTRAFVQCCPMLRRLSMWHVEGVDTFDAAKEFVESLSGFIQEHLEIALQSDTRGHRIWQDKEVKEAEGRVNATADGRSISIKYWFGDELGDDGYSVSIPSMHTAIGYDTQMAQLNLWEEEDDDDEEEEENMLQLLFGSDALVSNNASSVRAVIRKIVDFIRAAFQKMFY